MSKLRFFVWFLCLLLFCFVFYLLYIFFVVPPSSIPASSDSSFSVSMVDALVTPPPTLPPLSLDMIFDNSPFDVEEGDVVLYATGDIIPARLTDGRIRKYGVDYPFEHISFLFRYPDVVVSNLEAPLLTACPQSNVGMTFCGVADFAGALRRHSISIVSLENNHILDYGPSGRKETLAHLSNHGVFGVLLGQPVIQTYKDVRFGFAAVNGVGTRIDLERIRSDIYFLRHAVDVVVVSVHWGKEYTYFPQLAPGIAPDDPVVIGKALVDMGADLVLGNHPHWVQGVLLYKDGFITFSHGNFIFDQSWSEETMEGVIGSYIYRGKRLVDVSFIPVVIVDYAQPRLADSTRAHKILTRMRESSLSLQ